MTKCNLYVSMKKLVLFLLLMVSTSLSHAATPDTIASMDSVKVISTDTTNTVKSRKHPWLAGLEIVGFNVALVGFNSVVFKNEVFSHVSMETIKRNITHKYWVWDKDHVETNAWRHPVHGSLFYLIARANGMSIGESSLYTLGGSWMWEIFCEAEDPSVNDMVYTTLGGITIGETLWQSGKSILKLFKRGEKSQDSEPFTTSLSVGVRSYKGTGTEWKMMPYLTWEATYGDMYDDERTGLFEYFDMSGTLATRQKKRIAAQTRIDQQLWSHPLVNEPQKKVVTGIYNHFDYLFVSPMEREDKESIEPDAYSYSEVGAVGPGIAYRLGDHIQWEQQLYVNGILMGSVPEHHYHKESRDYSFGSGYGARLYSSLTVGDWLRMGVRAQCSHLFTWAGYYEDDTSRTRDGVGSIQGETGNALTAIISPTVEVKLMKHLSLQGSGQFMHTHLNYKYHPHNSTHAWEWQLGLKYTIHN